MSAALNDLWAAHGVGVLVAQESSNPRVSVACSESGERGRRVLQSKSIGSRDRKSESKRERDSKTV